MTLENFSAGVTPCFFPVLEKNIKELDNHYHCKLLLLNHRKCGSQFLQALPFRFAFKFDKDKTKSGEKRLISWHTQGGMVEVINDRKVLAPFRCNSEKCCRLAELRSGD